VVQAAGRARHMVGEKGDERRGRQQEGRKEEKAAARQRHRQQSASQPQQRNHEKEGVYTAAHGHACRKMPALEGGRSATRIVPKCHARARVQ